MRLSVVRMTLRTIICSAAFLIGIVNAGTCPCGSDPCMNNATCLNDQDTYSCECLPGFQGENCETELTDECLSSPCLNDGVCVQGSREYRCGCKQGWTGTVCQYACETCTGLFSSEPADGFIKTCGPALSSTMLDTMTTDCADFEGSGNFTNFADNMKLVCAMKGHPFDVIQCLDVCADEKVDVVFMVDVSGSIDIFGQNGFDEEKVFLSRVVARLDIGDDKTRVGIVKFDNRPVVEVDLRDDNTQALIQNHISNIYYIGGITGLAPAIRNMNTIFTFQALPGRRWISVFITDAINDRGNFPDAMAAIDPNILRIAVGVGPDSNQTTLEQIASGSGSSHVINLDSLGDIDDVITHLITLICGTE